jgi:hypothetical protein
VTKKKQIFFMCLFPLSFSYHDLISAACYRSVLILKQVSYTYGRTSWMGDTSIHRKAGFEHAIPELEAQQHKRPGREANHSPPSSAEVKE